MRKLSRRTILLLALLTVLAAGLRFWQLGQPGGITGDEMYFVTDAQAYVAREFAFDVHPPFGKQLIALGIWLFGDTPVGWRLMVALFGTLLVPLLFVLGWAWSGRERVGLGLGFLVAVDGLFVVESRLALLNTTLIFLTVAALLIGWYARRPRGWLAVGAALGLAVATKWVALFALVPLVSLASTRQHRWWVSVGLLLVGLTSVYLGVFGLHQSLTGSTVSLVETHAAMVQHHVGITERHAVESPWWSWPFNWRPFLYHDGMGPAGRALIAPLGNPMIWWGMLVLAALTLARHRDSRLLAPLLTFGTLWLPFAAIGRPMFNYHFMLAAPFLWLLALIGWDAWVGTSRRRLGLTLVAAALILTVTAFFWPVLTGQPLADDQLALRQWLPSWFRAR